METMHDNELIIVGPIRHLARFKRKACRFNPVEKHKPGSLCMANIVPPRKDPRAEVHLMLKPSISDSSCSYAESPNGIGAIQFNYESWWVSPVEFVRRASKLFPELEFHLCIKTPPPDDINLEFVAGECIAEFDGSSDDMDECLENYHGCPGPDPWKDGLFENPDAPKPDCDPDVADPTTGKDAG